jgi:hypothetical protein
MSNVGYPTAFGDVEMAAALGSVESDGKKNGIMSRFKERIRGIFNCSRVNSFRPFRTTIQLVPRLYRMRV